RVVEQGPVRAVIEVRHKVLHSEITQRIVLYRGLRRVDFEMQVDWHEKGSAHADAPMLRTTFAPYLDQTHATFEVAFAGLERPADGREVPALRWADLSESDYGVSLLNNCKYGHQAHGNTLGLTLVRASYEPDNNPDEGLHAFTYSLYPHQGTWKKANTEQRAAELNQPVQVAVTDGHPGKVRPGQSWLKCSAKNVAVSAVKFAEDQPAQGAAVIVRVYEAHGQAAKAKLQFGWPVARAEEVDMIEHPLGDVAVRKGTLQLALKPHEIKTLKLYTAAA
ncbi:MAG: glycosyl hydrolase-related protein, partial [Chloroflexi bacterium]|nr:glycosyl hydrolase-related protein [Chloroflexota bacterium]